MEIFEHLRARMVSLTIGLILGMSCGIYVGKNARFASSLVSASPNDGTITSVESRPVKGPRSHPSSSNNINLNKSDKPPDLLSKVTVSSSIASAFWSPPVFDMTTGELQIETLMLYEISLEKAKKLNTIIKNTLAKLNALEVDNSELKTDPNGDQFFTIKPFSNEGLLLKNELRKNLISEFADVGDDRGLLLADSISKHQFFVGFGQNRLELALEGGTDGKPQVIRVKTFLNSNGAFSSRDWMPGTNYVTERFRALIERNHGVRSKN